MSNQLFTSIRQNILSLKGAWADCVEAFINTPSGNQLETFINQRLSLGAIIYPATPFLALALTPLEQVRVVILGQDPYHGKGQAQGLAFSVAEAIKTPPSLRNILKELQRDLHVPAPQNGSLVRWAQQGVLLLNTTLTVEQGKPASHAKKGWEDLTDTLIQRIAGQTRPVVFLLWGAHAQKKEALILNEASNTGTQHLILKANHPSPLSATKAPIPFIGCGHFSLANEFLKQNGLKSIVW